MTARPLVSVLMTSYNREKYIGAAIESILASSYSNWELVIVDDRSGDQTVAIANDYAARDPRIRVYVNEENLGDYPNRNRAASYAKGTYLKYLDSDDLIYKYGLEAFIDFMEQDPGVGLGISHRRNITHQPFPEIMAPSTAIRHHFFKEGFLDCAPTGTIIRRECFESLGGFSGKRMIGDLEFGLKAASRYKVMLLPPGLIFWRHHGEQEVTYGIGQNMYAEMSSGVLHEQLTPLSADILTQEEKEKIFKSSGRSARISKIKFAVKKLLGYQK